MEPGGSSSEMAVEGQRNFSSKPAARLLAETPSSQPQRRESSIAPSAIQADPRALPAVSPLTPFGNSCCVVASLCASIQSNSMLLNLVVGLVVLLGAGAREQSLRRLQWARQIATTILQAEGASAQARLPIHPPPAASAATLCATAAVTSRALERERSGRTSRRGSLIAKHPADVGERRSAERAAWAAIRRCDVRYLLGWRDTETLESSKPELRQRIVLRRCCPGRG